MPEREKISQLEGRVEELRLRLQDADSKALADRTGAKFKPASQEAGEFSLLLWDREIRLSYPTFLARDAQNGEEIPTYLQALLLYYFNTCDGSLDSGRWIAFSELPDGRFYNQAFQGYAGKAVAQTFENDLESFAQVAESLAGKRIYFLGDLAYAFQVLPLVSLLVVYWRGDEEMQSTCQILFDAAVSHHLPTDACAVIGSTLTGRLIKHKNVENLDQS